MKVALDHVQLAIPPQSEAACRAFWCSLIGLTEVEKPEVLKPRGGLWLALDDGELHLGVEKPFAPAKKAHPGFRVADIENLALKLSKADRTIIWDTTIPGRKRFFTEDPFGSRLEFLED